MSNFKKVKKTWGIKQLLDWDHNTADLIISGYRVMVVHNKVYVALVLVLNLK